MTFQEASSEIFDFTLDMMVLFVLGPTVLQPASICTVDTAQLILQILTVDWLQRETRIMFAKYFIKWEDLNKTYKVTAGEKKRNC